MSGTTSFARVLLRGGRRAFRLLLRYPAAIISTVLGLIAVGLGYRIWRLGFRNSLPSLSALLVCVLLIIVILLTRTRIRQFAQTSVSEGKTAVTKQVAKQAVRETAELAEDLLERGTASARGALDSLTAEVKSNWERVVDRPALDPASPKAVRCPSCGAFVRSGARFCDGCGEPLPAACPQCHRSSRPGAKFCDHCGAAFSA